MPATLEQEAARTLRGTGYFFGEAGDIGADEAIPLYRVALQEFVVIV